MRTSTQWLRGLTTLGLVLASAGLAACVSTDLPLGDAPTGQAGTGNTAGSDETGSAGSAGASGDTTTDAGTVVSAGCAPLDPVTSTVVLSASEIVDAGKDTDGTVYVLTESDSTLRLFVGASGNLQEEFEAGTGQGNDGTRQFWTLQYSAADGSAVTVEVQEDASGKRMGVVKGPLSGKGFNVGEQGSVLTPITPATAATMHATSTETFHIEYTGASTDETVLVSAPDHHFSLDSFRLFLGPLDSVSERSIERVARGNSIPTHTTLNFVLADASKAAAEAAFSYQTDSPDATLAVGTAVTPFHEPAEFGLPAGATFLCKP
ncbi:MAG: hypothetical protein ABI488_17335 [Polyangiaceae bacterium]